MAPLGEPFVFAVEAMSRNPLCCDNRFIVPASSPKAWKARASRIGHMTQRNISNEEFRSDLEAIVDNLASTVEVNTVLVQALMSICVEYHGARFRKLLVDQLYLASQLDDHAVADRVARIAGNFVPAPSPPVQALDPMAASDPVPPAPPVVRKRFNWRTTKRGRRQD